jgi:hypothetical protein
MSSNVSPNRSPINAGSDGDERQTAYRFDKNAKEVVLASLSKFKGNTYADLRVFALGEGDKLIPTKKGLTLSLALIGELEEAVRRLRGAAEAAGLL